MQREHIASVSPWLNLKTKKISSQISNASRGRIFGMQLTRLPRLHFSTKKIHLCFSFKVIAQNSTSWPHKGKDYICNDLTLHLILLIQGCSEAHSLPPTYPNFASLKPMPSWKGLDDVKFNFLMNEPSRSTPQLMGHYNLPPLEHNIFTITLLAKAHALIVSVTTQIFTWNPIQDWNGTTKGSPRTTLVLLDCHHSLPEWCGMLPTS